MVIAHLTNGAVCILPKDGEERPEIRTVLQELRLKLFASRTALDRLAKFFPKSKKKDKEGRLVFYNIDEREKKECG